MPFNHFRRTASAAAFAATLLAGVAGALAAAGDYRFELAGNPQTASSGKSIVAVRLTHAPDNKPVEGAVITQSRADMAPEGMKEMVAPIKALPPEAGVYRFEIEPGMAGTWMLTLAAKVQGEAETVRGSITVKLAK
jgi:hypothetical protein